MREMTTDGKGELEGVQELARRYHFDFVDLRDCRPDADLLRSIPLELMVHYGFLPLEARDHELVVAVSDPTDLARLDELETKLDRRLIIRVAAPSQIHDFLKKTEPSQRVLDEATEEFRLDVIRDEGRRTRGPFPRTPGGGARGQPHDPAVDSIIFAGLETRRASDIHIESRDNAVVVKYRIDGVLQQAMAPLAREFQSNLITRIKVMAELDIAEDRVLAVDGGHDGNAEVDGAAAVADAETAVLRDAPLGDVELGHDLDARDEVRLELARQRRHGLLEHAIDAVLHHHRVVPALDVDIARAPLEPGEDERIDQPDHRAPGALLHEVLEGESGLVAFLVPDHVQAEFFRGLFEHALRGLCLLEEFPHLARRGDTHDELAVEFHLQLVEPRQVRRGSPTAISRRWSCVPSGRNW